MNLLSVKWDVYCSVDVVDPRVIESMGTWPIPQLIGMWTLPARNRGERDSDLSRHLHSNDRTTACLAHASKWDSSMTSEQNFRRKQTIQATERHTINLVTQFLATLDLLFDRCHFWCPITDALLLSAVIQLAVLCWETVNCSYYRAVVSRITCASLGLRLVTFCSSLAHTRSHTHTPL